MLFKKIHIKVCVSNFNDYLVITPLLNSLPVHSLLWGELQIDGRHTGRPMVKGHTADTVENI